MYCLLATHTMSFAAVVVVLLADYWVWQRKVRTLRPSEWALLLLPQVVLGFALLAVWNPFSTVRGEDLFTDTVRQRITLFWWNLRDLCRAELGVGLLLAAAPLLWKWGPRHPLLLRGPVAILVYCGVMAVVSPKVVAIAPPVADVRYLLPLIPVCIAVGAFSLRLIVGRRAWLAVPLGLVAFGTNLLNFGPALPQGLRSTPALFVEELGHPVPGPYGATIRWMYDNVTAGQTIWVLPGYATFPLMYHCPTEIYAWQLKYPPEPQFAGLGAIHFIGREPPDLMIAFGPYIGGVLQIVNNGRKLGLYYRRVAVINEYWVSEHLPSLLNHQFKDKTDFDRRYQAVYVYRRVSDDPGPQWIDR